MAIQDPLTGLIIGCCYRIANELGNGFLEKVYENALAHELRKAGVKVVQQQKIEVFYGPPLVTDCESLEMPEPAFGPPSSVSMPGLRPGPRL